MNTPSAGKGGKDLPEMTVTDLGPDPMHPGRKGGRAGLSMDMGMNSPYLLPAELNDSRGSIHSMSRSFQDTHDPYRPVTFMKNSGESMRSPSNPFADKASVYSAATSVQSNGDPFANPAFPKRGESKSSREQTSPVESQSSDELPLRQMHSQNRSVPSSRRPSQSSEPSLPNIQESTFVPPPPPPPPPAEEKTTRPARTSSASAGSAGLPARKQSIPRVAVPPRESSNYGDDIEVTPASPPRINESQYDIDPSLISTGRLSLDQPTPLPTGLAQPQAQNNRLSVMGLRPLPSDLPEDNPEIRANRIRSFYKEYFDDSKSNPMPDSDLLADGAIFDPATGQFVTSQRPFAQPVGRRAMTPPPRGAMGPGGGWSRGATPTQPHRRTNSTQSGWGRGGPRGRAPPMPKKRAPPPAPLKNLPTPHLLKDDTAIFNADDFAPPVSYRDRQAGRSESPVNGSRPYSPAVSAHVPLVSAYSELSPMPSPYLLRKSGTFTALDFAPPSVFGGQGNASDAGSIKSNRSGVSAMQQDAIRAGAYRVSRIPTDMVTTKDDLMAQLKPSWDIRRGDKVTG